MLCPPAGRLQHDSGYRYTADSLGTHCAYTQHSLRSQGYTNAKEHKCVGLLVFFGILIVIGCLILLFQLLLLAATSCRRLIAKASWVGLDRVAEEVYIVGYIKNWIC